MNRNRLLLSGALSLGSAMGAMACNGLVGNDSVSLWSENDGGQNDGTLGQGADGGEAGAQSQDSAELSHAASEAGQGPVDATFAEASPEETSTPDAGTTPPESGAGDSATDGGVVAPSCTLPLVACGAQCVNLGTSGSNCGACNHGCGNGENNCSQGLCTPVTVMTDGPIVGLGVDNGNVFVHVEYDGGAGGIDQCAVTGCAPLKHVVASSNEPYNYDPRITASGGIIGIQSAQGNGSLETCLESSCTFSLFGGELDTWVTAGNVIAEAINGSRANYVSVLQVALDGGATGRWGNGSPGGTGSQANPPLAIDGTNFVFSGYTPDAGTGLVSCTVASNCADPVIVTTTVPGIVDVYGGTVFLTTPGSPPNFGGSVKTCPAGAACPTPANFVDDIYPLTIVETSVDASGYYWLNSQGRIWTCKRSGCNKAGIPVTNAGTDPAASMFALYDGFVYFSGTGSNAATVYRIAEPAP